MSPPLIPGMKQFMPAGVKQYPLGKSKMHDKPHKSRGTSNAHTVHNKLPFNPNLKFCYILKNFQGNLFLKQVDRKLIASTSYPYSSLMIQLIFSFRVFNLHLVIIIQLGSSAMQCTTDIPIKPINRPINRYRPINRIGKSDKSQYRIGIGSADYKGLYRLIGFGSKMSLIQTKLEQKVQSKIFHLLKNI